MFTGFFRGRKDDEQFYKTKACKKLQNLLQFFTGFIRASGLMPLDKNNIHRCLRRNC